MTDEALDSEAQAAVRALAEGEASLVQYLYLAERDYFTPDEVDVIVNDSAQTDDSFLDEYPPVLINNLAFPYVSGSRFVGELYLSLIHIWS